MLSLLYSLWSSSGETPAVIYSFVSFYTWVTGVVAVIPDFIVIDTLLAVWTLFHLFVAASFMTVPDAFYKETIMKIHYYIASKFYNPPLLAPVMTMALALLTARLCYQAWNFPDNSEATLRAVIAVYTWGSSIVLQKLSIRLVKLGVDKIMEDEQELERHDIANFQPPPQWTRFIFAPLNLILRPVVVGADNLSQDQPGLYVANHGLLGLEIAPFVMAAYSLRDVFLRGLADHFHFGQIQGEFMRYFGGVDGTRKNVDCLIENKHNVLVYPGGGHEVLKPSTIPRYTLMWKERLGFVRMAIKYGYPLIPCCSVGTEDMMDIMFDIPLDFARKDLKFPVIAPILPHRLQRVYFWFGEAIPTAQYKGDWKNDVYAREIRDKVKAAVQAGIREMQEKQANDPNRFLLSHIGNMTKDAMKAMVDFCQSPFGTSSSLLSSPSYSKELEEPTQEEVPLSKKAD